MKPMVLTKENVLPTMEGRKTMSRRLGGLKEINKNPDDWEFRGFNTKGEAVFRHIVKGDLIMVKPRYQDGDEVYVAEGYQIQQHNLDSYGIDKVVYHSHNGIYLADNKVFDVVLDSKEYDLWTGRKCPYRPTPGRFMYKSLARTRMKITGVGVQRVQDISDGDIKAEGFVCGFCAAGNLDPPCPVCRRDWFIALWNSIHGNGAFELNPYVFVYKWDKE